MQKDPARGSRSSSELACADRTAFTERSTANHDAYLSIIGVGCLNIVGNGIVFSAAMHRRPGMAFDHTRMAEAMSLGSADGITLFGNTTAHAPANEYRDNDSDDRYHDQKLDEREPTQRTVTFHDSLLSTSPTLPQISPRVKYPPPFTLFPHFPLF